MLWEMPPSRMAIMRLLSRGQNKGPTCNHRQCCTEVRGAKPRGFQIEFWSRCKRGHLEPATSHIIPYRLYHLCQCRILIISSLRLRCDITIVLSRIRRAHNLPNSRIITTLVLLSETILVRPKRRRVQSLKLALRPLRQFFQSPQD